MTEPRLEPVQSSNIDAVGHEGTALYVRYKGRDGRPGDLWRYAGVPQSIFAEMKGSGSVGRYIAQFIKPNHPGTRVG